MKKIRQFRELLAFCEREIYYFGRIILFVRRRQTGIVPFLDQLFLQYIHLHIFLILCFGL